MHNNRPHLTIWALQLELTHRHRLGFHLDRKEHLIKINLHLAQNYCPVPAAVGVVISPTHAVILQEICQMPQSKLLGLLQTNDMGPLIPDCSDDFSVSGFLVAVIYVLSFFPHVPWKNLDFFLLEGLLSRWALYLSFSKLYFILSGCQVLVKVDFRQLFRAFLLFLFLSSTFNFWVLLNLDLCWLVLTPDLFLWFRFIWFFFDLFFFILFFRQIFLLNIFSILLGRCSYLECICRKNSGLGIICRLTGFV